MAFLDTLAADALDLAARSLPPRLLLGLADAAGALAWRLSPARRRVVAANLGIALGSDVAPGTVERIGRACCCSLARVAAELALADRLLGTRGGARRRFAYAGDWDDARREAAAGRGGIVVTAHLGNWEAGAFAARARGLALRAVARPMGSPPLQAWIERRRGGAARLIGKTGGLKDVIRALRAGRWVALLADQNAGRHGVFLPFFGLDASTFPTPAALAVRLGVPLYLGTCLRRRGAARFEVHLERVALPADSAGREAAIAALTLELNRRLEDRIRQAPGQYNWVHRRWKTRPPGRGPDEEGQPYYARLWPEGHPLTEARRTAPLR